MTDEQTIFKDPTAQTSAEDPPGEGKELADEKLPQQEAKKVKAEAEKEAIKDVIKQEEENTLKLEELEKKSQRILFTTESVFPFTLFPDKVVITEEKITIIHRNFFYSETVRSILGKDISNVNVDTSIFFATLNIYDRFFAKIPLQVKFLRKNEAYEARRIIQGMIVTSLQGIDLTKIAVPNIKERLEKIGSTAVPAV